MLFFRIPPRRLLISFIILILTSGCDWLPTPFRKAKGTTIHGQVRTYGTEDAIIQKPPVRVMITERFFPSRALGSGYSYKTLASTWTDSNGNFTLYHKLYEDNDYFLAVDGETIRSRYITPSYSSFDREDRRITQVGGTYTQNYYLTAYGWVRFHFVSSDPQPGDIYGYNFGGGASEIFYNSVNEYRLWDFGGNLEHQLAFNKYSNNQWINWQENVFIPAFDTTDMEIIF
ncbi:MAG: hypothetical protein SchgKO_25520 [Schleiferiaceae bacterium]